MDETSWAEAEVATDFYMMLPMDTSKAKVRTDVRMTYDKENLYVIVINFHALPGPYMVESLRRDFAFGKNDNFLLFMDPFDDLTNGFSFGANATGTQHRWNSWGFDYFSKPQSVFTYSLSMRQGGYYQSGSRFNLTADIGYRFQPYVSFLLSAAYNAIQLPDPWNTRRFWLIGPRLDVTFTNKLYFTAFAQYNEQQKNVNLNTRLQWRYRPASDLFIVYTDNYFPETFAVRNRALVLKFTYWWNL